MKIVVLFSMFSRLVQEAWPNIVDERPNTGFLGADKEGSVVVPARSAVTWPKSVQSGKYEYPGLNSTEVVVYGNVSAIAQAKGPTSSHQKFRLDVPKDRRRVA
jgi:hypothetical protein